jgi:hypothetical protein
MAGNVGRKIFENPLVGVIAFALGDMRRSVAVMLIYK